MRAILTSISLLALLVTAACGQSTHPLTGRRIAPVMGLGGADWLERDERAEEEMPDLAMEFLQVKPGMTVADVGAGVGYFTLRLAERVGPTGRVYATDIQPEMLLRLKKRAQQKGLNNIERIRNTEDDPRLPEGCCDVILMVDVYHELSRPQQFLQSLRKALKPDGRLVLLEYRGEDPGIPIHPDHKMTVKQAQTEVEAEGYRLLDVGHSLPRQHILVFGKRKES